jgi:AraC-like DNA-binding protein
MPAAATPMTFVHAVVRACALRGVDASGALARARIAPEAVHDAAARVTAAQFEALCDAAMRALDDEALGWFPRRLPWGSYGMLARASISAPRLGLALARWCRHHGLLTDGVALRLSATGAVARIGIAEHAVHAALREFCLVSLLRNVHGLACWLIDSRLPLLGAQFPFAAPAHADVYPLLFPGPVAFGAREAAIEFDARYLALPLARDEAALSLMLQRALPIQVLPYRRDRLLVQRVRQLLAAEALTAEALAQRLHVSPRTLHRQLQAEGAALQRLKDEARQARAIALLHRTDKPVKQVAQAAGFASEKSFIRAFRGWTGQSPAAFRQQGRSAE